MPALRPDSIPLKITKYLYVDRYGNARLTAKQNSPKDEEIELELKVEVPRKWFKQRSPIVEIKLDEPKEVASDIKIKATPSEGW